MPIYTKIRGKAIKTNVRFPTETSYQKVKRAAAMSNETINEFITSTAVARAETVLRAANQPQAVNQ